MPSQVTILSFFSRGENALPAANRPPAAAAAAKTGTKGTNGGSSKPKPTKAKPVVSAKPKASRKRARTNVSVAGPAGGNTAIQATPASGGAATVAHKHEDDDAAAVIMVLDGEAEGGGAVPTAPSAEERDGEAEGGGAVPTAPSAEETTPAVERASTANGSDSLDSTTPPSTAALQVAAASAAAAPPSPTPAPAATIPAAAAAAAPGKEVAMNVCKEEAVPTATSPSASPASVAAPAAAVTGDAVAVVLPTPTVPTLAEGCVTTTCTTDGPVPPSACAATASISIAAAAATAAGTGAAQALGKAVAGGSAGADKSSGGVSGSSSEDGSGDSESGSDGDSDSGDDGTAAAAAPVAPPPPPLLSAFELQRLANIERNQKFLASLNLNAAKPKPLVKPRSSGGGGKKRRRSGGEGGAVPRGGSAPTRRSARLQEEKANVVYDESVMRVVEDAAQRKEEEQLQEIDYGDSDVYKYVLDGSDDGSAGAAGGGAGADEYAVNGRKVKGVQLAYPGHSLQATGLGAIYSMHFNFNTNLNTNLNSAGEPTPRGAIGGTGLLAAGGKGGLVALFRSSPTTPATDRDRSGGGDSGGDGGPDEPLMAYRAHKGWVSAVQFVGGCGSGGGGGGGGGKAVLLLSSGNDGVVRLWDAARQHRGTPLQLAQACDLHSKGIFSMHYHAGVIATASKDKTVAISKLADDGRGIAVDRVLGDDEVLHTGVIKDVQVRDARTVASCGDDGAIRVCDLRSPPAAAAARINNAHGGACTHTVRWHPQQAHLLLSAGLDTAARLWDLRSAEQPLVEYRGHVPYALARYRAIHRPEFYGGGAAVVTCGERSEALSMYDTETGQAISRGVVGSEMSTLCVHPGNGTMLAAAHSGGEVVLLKPVWAERAWR